MTIEEKPEAVALPEAPVANPLAWGIYMTFGGPHVVPRNDTIEHEFEDCWCDAYLDEDSIVIHNSADKRELYERFGFKRN